MAEPLMHETCPACGVSKWTSVGVHLVKKDGGCSYCPNGHTSVYVKPEVANFHPDIRAIQAYKYLVCTNCGVPFGISKEYWSNLTKDKSFRCPNGHSLSRIFEDDGATDGTSAGPPVPPVSPRIGDAERDRAMERITEAYAAGQVRQDELDGILTRILAATRKGELEKIFTDLELPVPVTASPKLPAKAGTRSSLPTILAVLIVLLAIMNALMFVIKP